MTSIAKTTRVALAVAVVALASAGAASADVQHPAGSSWSGPSDYARPAGSSWSSLGSNHGLRAHLNVCRSCVI